jgi:dihydrofolate reductase
MEPTIILIACISENSRGVGYYNELVWKVPGDLKRFKKITTGHPVIMGRKTFESIGKPLPDRTNIVLTRDANFKADGVVVCSNTNDALIAAKKSLEGKSVSEVFIIGGGEIYDLFIKLASKLYLTIVSAEKKSDTFFPPYENEFTHIHSKEDCTWDELVDEQTITRPCSFVILGREMSL